MMLMRSTRVGAVLAALAFAGVAQAGGLPPLESKLSQADQAYQRGEYAVVMDVLQDVFAGSAADLSNVQRRQAGGLLADVYWRTGQYDALLAHSKRYQPARVHRVWKCLVSSSTASTQAKACWESEGQPNRMLRSMRLQVLSLTE